MGTVWLWLVSPPPHHPHTGEAKAGQGDFWESPGGGHCCGSHSTLVVPSHLQRHPPPSYSRDMVPAHPQASACSSPSLCAWGHARCGAGGG